MTVRSNPLSLVLISLMKGVTDREADPTLWQALLGLQTRVREHVSILGLDLILDEAEGYAYLRQHPLQEGEAELPRLIARRQLGYPREPSSRPSSKEARGVRCDKRRELN